MALFDTTNIPLVGFFFETMKKPHKWGISGVVYCHIFAA